MARSMKHQPRNRKHPRTAAPGTAEHDPLDDSRLTNPRKILRSLFVHGPVSALLVAVRLLFLLVLGPLALLVALIEWICRFVKRKNLKEEEDDDECNPPFPEDAMRRPDPCIYSQSYLASQGLPVTWNNPDIWLARASTPNVIEPDSYHLEADTDYIVSVRCHNASTDLALGVRVRLLYRPWSFNSPELLPVTVNASGQEVVRFVNIPGMGSAIAQFHWHTPTAPPGETRHFCLQAHLSHPMDINLENNMGQENTNVHSANPGHVRAGELVEVDVPLFNNARREQRFILSANAYAVDTTTNVQLELRPNTGREPWPLSKRIGSLIPTFAPAEPSPVEPSPVEPAGPVLARRAAATAGRPSLGFGRRERRSVTRARYIGHEPYRQALLAQDVALPPGMRFEAVAPPLLRPAEQRAIPVRIRVPDDAQTGTQYSINVRAEDAEGRLEGGVTFLLEVRN
jgi:hypothetical protein